MPFLKGFLSSSLFAVNTVFWSFWLFPFIILRFLIPIPAFKDFCTNSMVAIGQNWISCNGFGLNCIHTIHWNIKGVEKLSLNHSYLVCSNHQSWVDIVILQKVFNRKIPFLRFFLKQELFYIPFLGLAWWALDFPFMKRYSKEYLEKHPEKRGKDLETTQIACQKFKGKKISILNFLEGTRWTEQKHIVQKSPFQKLLKPKTGGIAFVIESMGDQFHSFLDVSILYPKGPVSLWGLFTGQLNEIYVFVEEIKIPKELLHGNYLNDSAFRDKMQNWILDIWSKKDQMLIEESNKINKSF